MAIGFVIGAVTAGQPAVVYQIGRLNGLSGIVEGTTYYLSATTAGMATTTPPAGPNISQVVGKGVATDTIEVALTEFIQQV